MAQRDFAAVWDRIVANQRNDFTRADGTVFQYKVDGIRLWLEAVSQPVPKVPVYMSQFRKAFDLVPLSGPGMINGFVFAPAYVCAILMDPRIRMGEW